MSLSKYFKSSDSFKPEEIVKTKDASASGWQSTPQKQPSPFEQQTLSEATINKSPPPEDISENNNESTTQEKDQKPPAKEKSGSGQPSKPAAEETIDLSKYIEISEHEKKLKRAYQDGVKDRSNKIEQDYETATKTLLVVCQQLDEIRNTIISNSSKELQQFALSIAERILRISVTEQDYTIIATIEEALQKSVKSDEFAIFIHPDDYDAVITKSEDLVAEISGLTNLIIKRDITVERGGARIESENCIIDATISSQFDTIREAIQQKL